MANDVKIVAGMKMEKIDGRWTVVMPVDERPRVYWCMTKPDGEIIALHEGAKGKLTAEMLLDPFIDLALDVICYEITPEEFDELKNVAHTAWAKEKKPKDLRINTRESHGKVLNGKAHIKDHTGEMTPRHRRTFDEMEKDNLRKEIDEHNAIMADIERRRKIKENKS